MSAAAGLLQTDDVAPRLIVHTQTSSARSTPCVLFTAIVRTLCVATAISSPRARGRFPLPFCRMKRRSALPRRLRLRSSLWLFRFSPFPYPCTCLVFCSHHVGSAVSLRVAPFIFRLWGESGAYSRTPLLPPAFLCGTPVLVSWPLVRTV